MFNVENGARYAWKYASTWLKIRIPAFLEMEYRMVLDAHQSFTGYYVSMHMHTASPALQTVFNLYAILTRKFSLSSTLLAYDNTVLIGIGTEFCSLKLWINTYWRWHRILFPQTVYQVHKPLDYEYKRVWQVIDRTIYSWGLDFVQMRDQSRCA